MTFKPTTKIVPCKHNEIDIYYDVYAGDGSGNDGKFVCSKCRCECKRIGNFKNLKQIFIEENPQ